jgi:hypothetical protein
VLLDVEKLVFHTDASGAVRGAGPAAPEVLVTAKHHGAHASGPDGGGGGGFVVLDVALVALVSGLPGDAHQLAPWLAACLLLVAGAALCVVPVGGLLRHPAQRFWDKRAQHARRA